MVTIQHYTNGEWIMGDQYIYLNGTWEPVEAGAPAIPDSGVLYDDWADNAISSRDTYSETAGDLGTLEVESSSYSDPSLRPTWTVQAVDGSWSGSNSRLELSSNGNANYITAPLDGGSSVTLSNLTIEFDAKVPDGASKCGVSIAQDTGFRHRWHTTSGYGWDFTRGGWGMAHLTSSNDNGLTSAGSGSNDGNEHHYRWTVDNSNTWTLYLDGTSVGSATDSSYTSATVLGFGARDTAGEYWIDNLQVY